MFKEIYLQKWLPTPGSILFTLLIAAILLYTQRADAVPNLTVPKNPSATSTTTFPYQGRLIDSNGNPINATKAMTFRLYNVASGGTALWQENWPAVQVSEGLFNVLLGSTTPIPQNEITDNDSLWLGVTVSTDTEMAPRVQVGSVPYAVRALNIPDNIVDSTFYYPFYHPQTLDLTSVDSELKGFFGGFTDGRYGYFVPLYHGVNFGKLVRVDLQNFANSGVTVLDLTLVDSNLKGFWGGFTDGRYGYLVPYENPALFGKVVRVDLQNFSVSGVTVLDLTTVDSDLAGFRGGFTDGSYAYFVPHFNGVHHGKVVRVSLSNFSSSGVTVLDLTTIDPYLQGFHGGFTDGRYGYFVPQYNNSVGYFGKVARVDLQNFSASGTTVLDLTTVDPDLKGFNGGFTDGRYGYFVPFNNGSLSGKVARVDLQNFTSGGVTVLDLADVDPDLKGLVGGFTDGRYGYFAPYSNESGPLGKVARVDLQNFSSSGVTVLDMTTVDPDLKGFEGGFSDGRYGYFVPNYNGDWFGKIARIQLFSGNGAP